MIVFYFTYTSCDGAVNLLALKILRHFFDNFAKTCLDFFIDFVPFNYFGQGLPLTANNSF